MITLSKLLDEMKGSFPGRVKVIFRFPSFYIIVEGTEFDSDSYFENLNTLSAKIMEHHTNDASFKGLSSISECLARNNCNIIFGDTNVIKNSYSFLAANEGKSHWLSMYDNGSDCNLLNIEETPRAFHFYGNKGGQARSTFLAMFARFLANQGHRVLLIDADIEAPTLHVILGINEVKIESTLINYCSDLGLPRKVAPSSTIPNVGLISCRPTSEEWEADYISFCLKTATAPNILSDGIELIKNNIINGVEGFDYDIVLFDHRTGAAHSVIPVMSAWPGSSLIFSRPDSQTNWLSGIKTILNFYPNNPGLFISFNMDSNSTSKITRQEEILRENLLLLLSDALTLEGAEDQFSPDELEEYYLTWAYDRSLLNGVIPDLQDIQNVNLRTLRAVYDLLDIDSPREKINEKTLITATQSVSGAKDQTWFVESDTTRLILDKNSNINYILGRKGTGKSRIFKEALDKKIGLTLIAPSEFGHAGNYIHSANMYLCAIRKIFSEDYHLFWWFLIYCRITAGNDDVRYESIIQESSAKSFDELKENASPISILRALNDYEDKQAFTLLIDGLETMSELKPSDLKQFVASLLSCMTSINNGDLSKYLKIKLFLRMDLIIGNQNIEQQIENRSIELSWNEQAQLNYNIASIAANNSICYYFPEVRKRIIQHEQDIKSGKLDISTCEDILLSIFPDKLRRSNIKSLTFLKTYFRDASSAMQEHKATFYPRLFLNFITEIGQQFEVKKEAGLDHGRILHSLIMDAYEKAAAGFLNDVKQELVFAIELNDDYHENVLNIDKFIQSFSSHITPFLFNDTVDKLMDVFNNDISESKVIDALNRMKAMGIFEPTAKDASKWRAGRVYKSALRMKYLRR
ncbi:MinD/ParA family ATP-binding protein [Aeromonas hydrophila]|uniref:MinD/ParA family ATP-binding protein n=1 Tax=Aeromonas hydrophila TaxID=644 RepID=UPI00207C88F2|nr:AAA family ATPase [Aeromonas hydrophila]MCO4213862.1 ParA family protein [Aeromonas hydrophila]HDX8442684.1 AAA family ATPase [Aeromonas hydrophila]HDX8633739.1 AAA family ATPase [Aeromonas hydrophila]